jgi:hypothetical protein
MFCNRLVKMTRVWPYPLLQYARSAAFTVIVPITSPGVAVFGAHVLFRWVPFHVYRLTSRHWPVARPELMRAISIVLLSLLTVCSFDLSTLLTWTGLALLLWNVFRACRDIHAVFDSARHLDRSSCHATTQRRENAIQRRPAKQLGELTPLRACGGINGSIAQCVSLLRVMVREGAPSATLQLCSKESPGWRAVVRHDVSAVRALS